MKKIMNRMAHGAHKSFCESNKERKKMEVKLKWNQKPLQKVYSSIFWKCTKCSVDFGCQWNKINFENPSWIFSFFQTYKKRIQLFFFLNKKHFMKVISLKSILMFK